MHGKRFVNGGHEGSGADSASERTVNTQWALIDKLIIKGH